MTTQAAPPGSFDSITPDPSFDDLPNDQETYGTPSQMVKTAVEQGLAGATLGASKVLETHGIPALGIPAITTPEAIAGREANNPVTATLFNIAGTGALIAGTGGAGALGEGAGLAAKVGLTAIEGGAIGGVNQATDDWSQNKPLDAQKIAAAAGIGTLLGTAGGAIGEGLAAWRIKPRALAQVPGAVSEQADLAAAQAAEATAAPVTAPETGVQPTSFEQISERVQRAKNDNTAVPLPAQGELDDALSRTHLENPINPLQRDSLASQEARDIYLTAKETPGEVGPTLTRYEGVQKAELVNKMDQSIQSIAPGTEVTPDAYKGGQKAIEAFTNQYQAEKEALSPIFENLKSLPVDSPLLPDSIHRMSQAVKGLSNMFEVDPAKIGSEAVQIRPYKTAWGIDRATYNAVKEAADSLSSENNDFETLWNVRKGLDQHVDVLTQGQAPREIRALKAALMDQMQDLTNNPQIREAFQRYAVNEQERHVIEKSFGASVGSQEFGQISKVKPEVIGDKIFNNTATTQAAKNILPPDQFQNVLANWVSEARASATDKGVFSSNKFASFLRKNQDALNVGFGPENADQLQRLKDLTTISRIIPDAASINPSGTAKTLSRMILGNDFKLHNLTWEGLLASIPKKIGEEIYNRIRLRDLNQRLAGQALQNSQEAALKAHVENVSQSVHSGVKVIFGGSASQARKANAGK